MTWRVAALRRLERLRTLRIVSRGRPPRAPESNQPRLATPLALVALGALVAASGFRGAFELTARVAVPVGLAAVLPPLIAAVMAVSTPARKVWLTAATSTAAWLAVLVLTVFGPSGAWFPAGLVPDALAHGLDRLLQITLPAPPRADLLAVVVTLIWLAAASASMLVAAGTGRDTLTPVAPIAMLFVAATLISLPGPGSHVSTASVLVAVFALIAAVSRPSAGRWDRAAGPAPVAGAPPAAGASPAQRRAHGTGRRPSTKAGSLRHLVAVLTITCVAAGSFGLASLVTLLDPDPFDVREYRSPPARTVQQVDLLALVSAWQAEPRTRLFTLEATDALIEGAPPDRMRLAVLDRYDGRNWSSASRYIPAGLAVPAPEDVDGPVARHTLTIDRLSGPYLPVLGWPTRLDASGLRAGRRTSAPLAVDLENGLLSADARLEPGRTVEITSILGAAPTLREAGERPVDPIAEPVLALPGNVAPPGDLTAIAQKASRLAAVPGKRASVLADLLAQGRKLDRTVISGSSLGDVEAFLGASRVGGDALFATAFALAANTIGLPTRLVIGFDRPSSASDGAVHAGDVRVWPEVRFAEVGWVPVDLGSSSATGTGETPLPSAGTPDTGVHSSTPSTLSPPANGVRVAPPRTPLPRPDRPVWAMIIAVIVVVLGLAVTGAWWATRAERRRRRARSEASPRRRLIEAWWDAVETMGGRRRTVLSSDTCAEVVREAREVYGERAAEPLAELGTDAARALFSASDPRPAEADRAWDLNQRFRKRLRTERRRRRRAAVRAAPRHLSRALRRAGAQARRR
ncbi:transglutaminase domain protein [Parafrankia sp. EAN1pec]|nr:transglutaminase domain protein [Frankia sp. EAN1pec]